MHFLKKGQKIRAWVDPPPLIRAMPERKRFFSSLRPSLMRIEKIEKFIFKFAALFPCQYGGGKHNFVTWPGVGKKHVLIGLVEI